MFVISEHSILPQVFNSMAVHSTFEAMQVSDTGLKFDGSDFFPFS